jgi:hypothetical protein
MSGRLSIKFFLINLTQLVFRMFNKHEIVEYLFSKDSLKSLSSSEKS